MSAPIDVEDNMPWEGDRVMMNFSREDSKIIVSHVPLMQPAAQNGEWVIVDQYDDRHVVEWDNGWVIVTRGAPS